MGVHRLIYTVEYSYTHFYTIAFPAQLGFAVNITDKVLGDATFNNTKVQVNILSYVVSILR